jgi:hypothetical protein
VCSDGQHVGPDHSKPPHCPHRGAQYGVWLGLGTVEEEEEVEEGEKVDEGEEVEEGKDARGAWQYRYHSSVY